MAKPDPDPVDSDERRWKALLEWLRGHGMLVDGDHLLVRPRLVAGAGCGLFAIADVPRRAPLLTLPSKAKLNAITLGHYPHSKRLTATQIISLHLVLYRPAIGCESDDPHFGPYISILPRDFGDHPLTWIVHRTLGRGSHKEHRLLDLLPPSVLADLLLLELRFWKDWEAVRQYMDDLPELSLRRHRTRLPSDLILDFMWAWLNVNTRCLYDDLGLDKDDNMSLCPVFDFANHAWMQPTMEPVRAGGSAIWGAGRRRTPGGGGNSDLVCVSCDKGIARDQEVTLRYGWHPNRTLFVEYGFTNAITSEEFMSGAYPGEVNVQDIVSCLMDCRSETGAFVKRTLDTEGYWGDWTMHCSPLPAHASFRLITALRLYHSFPPCSIWAEEHMNTASRRWRDTIMGYEDDVSEENEKACRETIRGICEVVISRAERGIKGVKEEMKRDEEGDEWYRNVLRTVELLWLEERSVGGAVLLA